MAISLATAYISPCFTPESSNSASPSRTLSSVRLPSQIRRFGSVQSPSSSTRFAPLTVSSPFTNYLFRFDAIDFETKFNFVLVLVTSSSFMVFVYFHIIHCLYIKIESVML